MDTFFLEITEMKLSIVQENLQCSEIGSLPIRYPIKGYNLTIDHDKHIGKIKNL